MFRLVPFALLEMKASVPNYPSISTLFSDYGLLVIAVDKECEIAELSLGKEKENWLDSL